MSSVPLWCNHSQTAQLTVPTARGRGDVRAVREDRQLSKTAQPQTLTSFVYDFVV